MCMNHAGTWLFWMSVLVNASYIAKRVTAVSPELQPQRDHPTFALFSQISSLLPPLPLFLPLLRLPPPRVSLTECDSGVSRGAQVARLL